MTSLRDVGDTFFAIGLYLVIIPGLIVLASCLYPFVPREINQFFLKPDYKQDPAKVPETGENKTSDDLQISEPISKD